MVRFRKRAHTGIALRRRKTNRLASASRTQRSMRVASVRFCIRRRRRAERAPGSTASVRMEKLRPGCQRHASSGGGDGWQFACMPSRAAGGRRLGIRTNCGEGRGAAFEDNPSKGLQIVGNRKRRESRRCDPPAFPRSGWSSNDQPNSRGRYRQRRADHRCRQPAEGWSRLLKIQDSHAPHVAVPWL